MTDINPTRYTTNSYTRHGVSRVDVLKCGTCIATFNWPCAMAKAKAFIAECENKSK